MTDFKPGDLVTYEIKYRRGVGPLRQIKEVVRQEVIREVESIAKSGDICFKGGGHMPPHLLKKVGGTNGGN